VWGSERSTNDNLNRLIEHHYLHQAHEVVDIAQGRGNRIIFLTRTGLQWVLAKGHLRMDDIPYYWKGEGHWHPSYNEHNVLIHDVLCAFIKQANDKPESAIDLRLDPFITFDEQAEMPTVSSPLQDKTLLPDRIFALKHQDQVWECYLELDCGTEDKRQWQEKMKKYTFCPEVMEQSSVLVLTVANNQRRMETLLRWSQEIVDEHFWFSHMERICYQYTRDGKELILQQSGDPFGTVWCTVTDQAQRSLFALG